MDEKHNKATRTLKAVDFFCGGGGMSYGMQTAGVKVIAGIDYEPACEKTYLANIKDAKFINCDVFELNEKKLSKDLKLKRTMLHCVQVGIIAKYGITHNC